MGKGGSVLGLIGIILGAGGIAFGYYNWTSENDNSTQNKVVGVWDGLDVNRDYSGYNQLHTWLFEFTDNDFNDSDYVSVSLSNTRITLLKPGWYRIHFTVLLGDIDPAEHYYIRLLKNHTIDEYLFSVWTTSTATSVYKIDTSALVYSDGMNYIEIGASSSPQDTFGISGTNHENGLSIEFIST